MNGRRLIVRVSGGTRNPVSPEDVGEISTDILGNLDEHPAEEVGRVVCSTLSVPQLYLLMRELRTLNAIVAGEIRRRQEAIQGKLQMREKQLSLPGMEG